MIIKEKCFPFSASRCIYILYVYISKPRHRQFNINAVSNNSKAHLAFKTLYERLQQFHK